MNRLFYTKCFFILLFISCGRNDQSTDKKTTIVSDNIPKKKVFGPISITSNFPFGYQNLSKIKSPKVWPFDTANYGQLIQPEGKQFEEIGQFFLDLNGVRTIGVCPEITTLNHIKVGKGIYSDSYFDTIAMQRADSIKYRLTNIGGFHCYYAFQRATGMFGQYGNILLYDTTAKKGTTINVYYEVGGDQTVQFRYFLFDGKTIKIYEGICCDGCDLKPKYIVEITNDGKITVKDI